MNEKQKSVTYLSIHFNLESYFNKIHTINIICDKDRIKLCLLNSYQKQL
jgi:hypothetical protein